MLALFRFVASLVLGIVFPLLLQVYLSRRMSAVRRARGWNRVTWAFALYAVGPLSMIPFAWVTRRWRSPWENTRALAIGVGWTALLVAVITAIDQGYAMMMHLPP